MSQEITLTGSLKVTKGALSISKANVTVKPDMAGTHAIDSVQNLGTNAAALNLPAEITTTGVFMLRNIDPTNYGTNAVNYAEIGLGTGTNFAAFLKLLPGEIATGRLGTNTPAGRAHSGTIDVNLTVLQA